MVKSNYLTIKYPLCVVSPNIETIKNIPESSTAFIRDLDGCVNAILSMVKYSSTHAYCILAEIKRDIKDKFISIEEDTKNIPGAFTIAKFKETVEDKRLLPIYVQVHHNFKYQLAMEHLVNQLSTSTLGKNNLELKKNITIDLAAEDDFNFWRDQAGFIITDRQQLSELTVKVSSFLSELQQSSGKYSLLKLNGLIKR
ncbi:unnamed protein product [Dracunculus medinensis]|uniref:DUF7596 domain-containing protein n=1 Tax=Dracunculus medinensis TaxID=318479 RepID=A0A0N4UP20_DRAME|nr:unnamed protein product [Dracunculus medinensis]